MNVLYNNYILQDISVHFPFFIVYRCAKLIMSCVCYIYDFLNAKLCGGFAWAKPRSSDPEVAKPVICKILDFYPMKLR